MNRLTKAEKTKYRIGMDGNFGSWTGRCPNCNALFGNFSLGTTQAWVVMVVKEHEKDCTWKPRSVDIPSEVIRVENRLASLYSGIRYRLDKRIGKY